VTTSGYPVNLLLITYDSCRYDVLRAADTPVLDSFADVLVAEAPGNFTYPSHHAMFAGMLPNCDEPRPYYNRFCRQLFGLAGVGELQVANRSSLSVTSTWNAVSGLGDAGYQTVGAGAMNWFRQDSLVSCFQQFRFTGTDADAQIDYILDCLDLDLPFFAFINFGETHAPFDYKGKAVRCPVDVRARVMDWPPRQGEQPVGPASQAFTHQVAAAEYLDTRLPRVLSALPAKTVVVLCADHGECFGEDGYWGHGINHPMVLQVPLAIFRLDGGPLELTST
jgi:membrane-anchored protein YejM (alkaline phosphatase superfamily)